jgi:hypothetical protein
MGSCAFAQVGLGHHPASVSHGVQIAVMYHIPGPLSRYSCSIIWIFFTIHLYIKPWMYFKKRRIKDYSSILLCHIKIFPLYFMYINFFRWPWEVVMSNSRIIFAIYKIK